MHHDVHLNSPQPQIIVTDKELYEDMGNQPLVRSTERSAGYDLRSSIDFTLNPGEQLIVDTGLRIYLALADYVGIVVPRSGLGSKHGLILGNGTGIIDADYQGPLMVCLWNRKPLLQQAEQNTPISIRRGERIAQYLVLPVFHPNFTVVQEFTNTTIRGEGGFGHTGTR